MTESIKGKMNEQEMKKWAINTLKFFAPAIILFLGAIQSGTDLKSAVYLLYLWLINVTIDYLTKLSRGK